MGHLYPRNFSEFSVKRIYAKGRCTVDDLVQAAIKAKMEVSCAEGSYDDTYMIEMALGIVLKYHEDNGIIIAESSDENKEEMNSYIRGDFDERLTVEDGRKILEKVTYSFAKGGRKKYLDKNIAHLGYVCL
jgi:hypothetical protein